MARAEQHLGKDKQPNFVSSPADSCLQLTDYATYSALDAAGKLKLFQGKSAIIIRNWPVDPNLKFDEAGLRTIAACLTSPADLLGEYIAILLFIAP